MKKIAVSAPGKLMLFGEHAVLYGRPCIVTAVNQRLEATVKLTSQPVFQLNAPDVGVLNYQKPMSKLGQGDIPKGAKFVEIAVKNFLRHSERGRRPSVGIYINQDCHVARRLAPRNDKLGVRITTASEFSSQFGFGSSSASAVCVIKALSELTGANLDKNAIFDLAYQTVLDIQDKGSGFDMAAAIYGGTLYYVTPGKTIEPLKIDSLPLVVGYSGIKADTVTIVNEVAEKTKNYPKVIENIYNNIGKLVEQAKQALLSKDWQRLGELMNLNQEYLINLGVSSTKLESMIKAAREAGADGAKLSGAGIGDCMIALHSVQGKLVVKQAIEATGGQIIDVKTNAEGVRIEP